MKENSTHLPRAIYVLFAIVIFVLLLLLSFNAYMFVRLDGRLKNLEAMSDSLQLTLSSMLTDFSHFESEIDDLDEKVSAMSDDMKLETVASKNNDLPVSTDQPTGPVFSESNFPFTFSVSENDTVVTKEEPLLNAGGDSDLVTADSNEAKVISSSLKEDLQSAGELTGGETYTVLVTYFENSGIEDAKEAFYGDNLDFAEKVESVLIGTVVVDVYEGVSDIQGQKDYFVAFDDYAVVVSGRDVAEIEKIITSLK